jgi:hypothetical protein
VPSGCRRTSEPEVEAEGVVGVGSALMTGPLPALAPAGQLPLHPPLPAGVTPDSPLKGAAGLAGVPLLLASGVAFQPLAPALLTRT